jgi:hypothetical protein
MINKELIFLVFVFMFFGTRFSFAMELSNAEAFGHADLVNKLAGTYEGHRARHPSQSCTLEVEIFQKQMDENQPESLGFGVKLTSSAYRHSGGSVQMNLGGITDTNAFAYNPSKFKRVDGNMKGHESTTFVRDHSGRLAAVQVDTYLARILGADLIPTVERCEGLKKIKGLSAFAD